MENAVYLYEYNKNVEAVYQNLEFKDGGLDHKQIIFRYDVILDKWFSVPQMKTMMKYASLTADRNLVYLIGGGIHHGSRQSGVAKGYVQAYDHRTPKWFELSKTSGSYINAGCCTFNEKIFVTNGDTMEIYHPTAGKWEMIKCDSKFSLATSYVRRSYLFRQQLLA